MPTHTLSTPPLRNGLLEYRAVLDLATLPLRATRWRHKQQSKNKQAPHIFVLPGFGASDRTMAPLRYFLSKHGYQTHGWGLGVNRAGLDQKISSNYQPWGLTSPAPQNGELGVPYLCELMSEKVRVFSEERKTQVRLVGWSLGGTIAREVARDLPEHVSQVITLGSPLLGGPKYTAAAPLLAKRGINLDWIEDEVERRNTLPLKCKASAIISRTDGIVDYSASQIPNDNDTRYINTDVSHLGMGFNQIIMDKVLSELEAL